MSLQKVVDAGFSCSMLPVARTAVFQNGRSLSGNVTFSRRRWSQLAPVQTEIYRPRIHLERAPLPSSRWTGFSTLHQRSAKAVTRKKIKDLVQGPILGDALPPAGSDDVRKDTMLQGVRNNMRRFPNCVLLTKVGNFYELYYEHAEEFAPLLNLKCATKGKDKISMAGFQYLYLDRYLKILVQDLNKYVAICEEYHEYVDGKLVYPVDRRVARVVTPGTLIDEKFLDPYESNFLLSVHVNETKREESSHGMTSNNIADVGLAWVDLSTGEFFTQTTSRSSLPSALLRIGAREIVLPQETSKTVQDELRMTLGNSHELITLHQSTTDFVSMTEWNDRLESPLSPADDVTFSHLEKMAAHQIFEYIKARLLESELKLRRPKRRELREILSIDRSTLRGLEILETAREGLGKGSLFNAVRRTATKSGARLLRDRLTSPSTSITEINHRLELVSAFVSSRDLREGLVSHLRAMHDVQRLVQKFALNRGDADDMLCLARAVQETENVMNLLQHHLRFDFPNHGALQELISGITLDQTSAMASTILESIDEEGLDQQHRMEEDEDEEVAESVRQQVLTDAPEDLQSLPKSLQSQKVGRVKEQVEEQEDPWIMKKHASVKLQQLHERLIALKDEQKNLQVKLSEQLIAPTLSLKWTPGLGHICHIKKANGFNQEKLEGLKGRLVSASKTTKSFHVPDWSKLGEKTEQTRYNIRREEQNVFNQLRQLVVKNIVALRRNAAVMDEIDVSTSFAALAVEQSWTRPIVNPSTNHKIIGGRHPTVKLGLEEQGRSFVSNDLFLDDRERVWLVTGPNSGGKSVFLRQNALITILAQVGSFVPADYAEVGLVDQMFSRIGAADDVFRDQSTFMVEMLETAAILNHATTRSMVIMDEVGRGTTPEDGIAVSFASLHHLYHTNRCRTLFATHFHALADMTEGWKSLGKYCTDIHEETSGSFTFLHKLRPGVNRQSHALKVAKMAGLPDAALEVAEDVLRQTHQPQLGYLDSGLDRPQLATASG